MINKQKRFFAGSFYAIFFIMLFACEKEVNHPPDIQVFTVLQESIMTNHMATFSCVATDKDEDNLTYTWSCEKGSFINGNETFQTEWHAPNEQGIFTITVSVSDGEYLASDSMRVEVQNRAPQSPFDPMPINGVQDIAITDTLFWDCIDIDGDNLWYRVYFGLDPDPPMVEKYNSTGFYVPELLSKDKTYYWRVDAHDICGNKGKGATWSFSTLGDYKSFIDPRDGNEYEYRIIGTQTWMLKNLAYIPNDTLLNRESSPEKYYIPGYKGNSMFEAKIHENYEKYGVLYNSLAAELACPEGWHLPEEWEWIRFEKYLGMAHIGSSLPNEVGKILKSTTGWLGEGNGIDSQGFNVYPAGYYHYIIGFINTDHYALFWSSHKYNGYCRQMNERSNTLVREEQNKRNGLSVRCIKD